MRWLFVLGLALGFVLLGGFLAGGVANAGNLWLTGHDADFHCSGGSQCNHFGIAVNFGRIGAPTPNLPVLVLDRRDLDVVSALAQSGTRARNTVEGSGLPVPHVVVDPRSAAFAALPINVSTYSAIVFASDFTCGGCDLNDGTGVTPDSDAINARAADLAVFFNAGGGLVYMSGANNRGVYYQSVPVPLAAAAVSSPFTLTAEGIAIGLTNSDANCCATHNSFNVPPSGSPLIILEFDSAGLVETMIARGALIEDGGLVPPPDGVVPEPSTLFLLGTGLAALLPMRRRKLASPILN
jgi:hypothetical protein